MGTRWQHTDAPRGAEYDARWNVLAASGAGVHGEADLVDGLLADLLAADRGGRILDAGCGTGRVAIELERRGHSVVGVDADAEMLEAARAKAPGIRWIDADLADLDGHLDRTAAFDVVLLAGNVMIFLDPGSEERVLTALVGRLDAGGLVVAGFTLREDGLRLADYDRLAESAGLELRHRWATWDRDPFAGGEYAVSVHGRRSLAPRGPGAPAHRTHPPTTR